MTDPHASPLLTEAEAAQYLRLSPLTLRSDRVRRRLNIPFLRLGRAIRYRRADLDAWLANQSTQRHAC